MNEDLKKQVISIIKQSIKSIINTLKDNFFINDFYNIYKSITYNINQLKNEIQNINFNTIKNIFLYLYIGVPIFIFITSFVLIYFFHISILWFLASWILTILLIKQGSNQDMMFLNVQFNLKYSILGVFLAELLMIL
ncbi:MAG: hypothetical protein QXO65_03585 [Candidatus Aenigmatarchaeota archaeon]